MILGKIVFDHRTPLAIRAPGDDANDPARMVALCRTCDQRKTPRDAKEIARAPRTRDEDTSAHIDLLAEPNALLQSRPWRYIEFAHSSSSPAVFLRKQMAL